MEAEKEFEALAGFLGEGVEKQDADPERAFPVGDARGHVATAAIGAEHHEAFRFHGAECGTQGVDGDP